MKTIISVITLVFILSPVVQAYDNFFVKFPVDPTIKEVKVNGNLGLAVGKSYIGKINKKGKTEEQDTNLQYYAECILFKNSPKFGKVPNEDILHEIILYYVSNKIIPNIPIFFNRFSDVNITMSATVLEKTETFGGEGKYIKVNSNDDIRIYCKIIIKGSRVWVIRALVQGKDPELNKKFDTIFDTFRIMDFSNKKDIRV